MPHQKVVRRRMRSEEWADLRFAWLQRGICLDKHEITDLEIREGRQISEDHYEYDSDWHPLNRGDLYFSPDGTVFIRGRAVIPSHLKHQTVYLSIKTPAEMIVRINGHYAGGLDPNRNRICLDAYADAPELFIEIEGYNRSKPDDERNTDVRGLQGCRQIFQGAYFTTIRKDIQSLIYDFTLLLDIAHSDVFPEDYRSFLFHELNTALDLIDYETFSGIDRALAHIQTHIYENTDYRGRGNVALVGHSHLDIAYYWRRIHAIQKNARTILIQMRLMDQYPEFRYTHTQAYLYETLEMYYPELFAELKEKIESGQFEVVGGMYIEPDCNIPSAESLIRQCLYGQHYFRRAFNRTIDNAWLPDVFGNSWILPQILKKSGIDYFVSNKMATWNDTNKFPHNHFIWKGIDGSSVYACVPPTHFINWNLPSQLQENWEAYRDKQTGGQTLCMFGYGDGGSGCTEEMMELYRRFDRLSIMPKTELTGGSDFLHKNFDHNTKLETWDGELYLEMHRGTFTTKADLKHANRSLEFLLRDAEILSVLRYLNGKEYPADLLRDCYKRLLLNQFHDILPGSHIHPVYEDAMADYRKLEQELQAFVSSDSSDSGYFNTLNFDRSLISFIEDEQGTISRHGKKGFWMLPSGSALAPVTLSRPSFPNWLTADPDEAGTLRVKTPFYQVAFRADGSFSSLYDRELEREWVKDGCGFNTLHLYADTPGIYEAWDITPNYKDIPVPLPVSAPLSLAYCDDISAEFCVRFSTGISIWTMIIRLFANSRAIEVEHVVDWNEKNKLAKINFGPDVLTRELVCDTSAGYIKRDLTKNTTWQQARFEVCHHKWCDLSETDGGVAIINEDKYGVGLEGDEISLSLLRAPIRPDIASDIGHHDFCYLILPHSGDAISANINRTSLEYNIPVRKASSMELAMPTMPLYLQAMKLSENEEYIIIRLSEQDGRRGRIQLPFSVKLMNLLEDVQEETNTIFYHPFELITLGLKPEDLRTLINQTTMDNNI